ncbi:MAG TPA: LysR family transcriptional regulator, partial [Byssovorax sp.]
LAELEAKLGDALFVRGVEGVTPTTLGERLVAPARRMAEHAAEVERAVSGVEAGPKGVVRVTAPPGVAFTLLAPFAARALAALPDVRLEVVSTVHYVDLVRREADLAIRVDTGARPTAQRDLVVLATHTHRVAVFSTRALAARLGPRCALADVPWIGWAPPLEHLPPNPQLASRIPGFRPAFASDDFIVQLRAAEAGVGAIVLGAMPPTFALGELVELPISLGPITSSMHLVAARSALAVPRVRAVAELLARELAPPARRRRSA